MTVHQTLSLPTRKGATEGGSGSECVHRDLDGDASLDLFYLALPGCLPCATHLNLDII